MKRPTKQNPKQQNQNKFSKPSRRPNPRDPAKDLQYAWDALDLPLRIDPDVKPLLEAARPHTVVVVDAPGASYPLGSLACWALYGSGVPEDILVLVCAEQYVKFSCGQCARSMSTLKPSDNRLLCKRKAPADGQAASPLLLDYVNFLSKFINFQDLLIITNDKKMEEFLKKEFQTRIQAFGLYFSEMGEQKELKVPSYVEEQFKERAIQSLGTLEEPLELPDYYHMKLEELGEVTLEVLARRTALWMQNLRDEGKSLPKTSKKLENAITRLCRFGYTVDGAAVLETLKQEGFVDICPTCSSIWYPKKDFVGTATKTDTIFQQVTQEMKKWISIQKELPSKIDSILAHAATIQIPHVLPPYQVVTKLLASQLLNQNSETGILEYPERIETPSIRVTHGLVIL